MASTRQFDIILLGATGHTGKLCAEYITTSLPTNLKWAVAGRSEPKLQALVAELKKSNSDRTQPGVLTVELKKPDLDAMVKKAKVVINCVGPYHLYSTPVVEACANSGTHYLDVTGETPWVREIISKYEKAAKATGAILIPEIGIESCPSDIIAYVATALVRRVWDCGVMDMISAIHEIKAVGPSGGSLASGISVFSSYPSKVIKETMNDPFILSPSQFRPEPTTYTRSALSRFFGVWSYPQLGDLTTSMPARSNAAIVHRSAGMTPLFYGFNFTYEEFMCVSNPIIGALIHFALIVFTFLLILPPFRFIAKKIVPAPGSGPDPAKTKNEVLEYRAVAVAEQLGKPRKALATFRYEGSLYRLSGIFLAEAAICLLETQKEVTKRHGTGFLTPSCLGDPYVERLKKAGIKISVKQLGDIGSK